MKHQAIFSSKDNSKHNKSVVCLLGTLRAKEYQAFHNLIGLQGQVPSNCEKMTINFHEIFW